MMKKRLNTGFLPALFGVLLLSLMSCGGSKVIRSSGLSYIKLGDEIPPVGADRIKKYSLRDSVFEDGEYTWRAAIVEYAEGPVYLEADFFEREMLNRIRVETPELRLRNGLRVGNSVKELKESTNDWSVVPMKKFGLFEFSSELYPRIHFVVEDPSVPMESENMEDYPVDRFDEAALVRMIVLY